jgi:hypothetical protein
MLRLATTRRQAGRPKLTLPGSPDTDRFVTATAATGLTLEDAVALTLERELVLRDAGACGLTREGARHLLGARARRARARQPLSAAQARRVRMLTLARCSAAPDASNGIQVFVAERLFTRAEGRAALAAFTPSALDEAISWEVAAALEARSMTEWALAVVARAHRAA